MSDRSSDAGVSVYQMMTSTDWFGLGLSVVLFILTVGAYVYVFRPGARDDMESHRHIVMNEDRLEEEENDGR